MKRRVYIVLVALTRHKQARAMEQVIKAVCDDWLKVGLAWVVVSSEPSPEKLLHVIRGACELIGVEGALVFGLPPAGAPDLSYAGLLDDDGWAWVDRVIGKSAEVK